MIGWLGAEQLAAHEVAISMVAITFMVVTGFSAAGSIRVGDALGKNDPHKMLKAGNVSLFLTILFMSLCCIIFITANELLVSLFMGGETGTQIGEISLNREITYKISVSLIIIAAFFQLSDGVQATSAGLLKGLTDVNMSVMMKAVEACLTDGEKLMDSNTGKLSGSSKSLCPTINAAAVQI